MYRWWKNVNRLKANDVQYIFWFTLADPRNWPVCTGLPRNDKSVKTTWNFLNMTISVTSSTLVPSSVPVPSIPHYLPVPSSTFQYLPVPHYLPVPSIHTTFQYLPYHTTFQYLPVPYSTFQYLPYHTTFQYLPVPSSTCISFQYLPVIPSSTLQYMQFLQYLP